MVNITVLDINDHIPSFEMQRYQVNVSENAEVNDTLIHVVANDHDEVSHLSLASYFSCNFVSFFSRECMLYLNFSWLMFYLLMNYHLLFLLHLCKIMELQRSL